MGSNYIAFTVVALAGLGFALQFLFFAKFMGERRHSAAKDIPYEAGSDPIGDARSRFPVRFYPLAILFVVFDIEAAFLFPWAINFRELSCAGSLHAGVCSAGLSWVGLGAAAGFITVLLVALAYAWNEGVIGWG
jgi:NADH-quinone oxidoreductase subunit A